MSKYIGTPVVSLVTDTVDVTGDITTTDATPEVIIVNDTHEDTDGGREGKLTFKGQQSGGEETTLAQVQASHDGSSDNEKGDLIFKTNGGSDGNSPTERMRIDSDGNVGIGSNSPNTDLHIKSATPIIRLEDTDTNAYGEISASSGDGNVFIKADEGNGVASSGIRFHVDGSHVGRFQDEKFFIGKTSAGVANLGGELRNGASGDYAVLGTSQSQAPFIANRTSTHGDVFRIRKDNSAIATHLTTSYSYEIKSHMTELTFEIASARQFFGVGVGLGPAQADDDELDLGRSSARYDDVYATNGTIQTSDEREKQQITSLTNAEITAAKAISKLFKTFKWNKSVAENGENARTHTGVIAQQVETAMSDVGLNASNYAFYINTTWWESDQEGELRAYKTQEEAPEGATEHNRKGIRYPELLSFIGAATEQRLTSIEARLTALEGE